jgi:hypothetical protein
MKKSKRVKLEMELIRLKFKREWFEDRSSYWFNKNINFKDLKLNIYVQFNRDVLVLQVKNLKNEGVMSGKEKYYPYYHSIKWFKLNIKNVKSLIKKYGK